MEWGCAPYGLRERVSPLNTKLLRQIQLRMAAEGLIDAPFLPDDDLWSVTEDLIESYRARGLKLDDPFDPADRRMQDFIDGECRRMGVSEPPQLPWPTLRLDRAGLARELALPLNGNEFHNEVLECNAPRRSDRSRLDCP